ncbi:hypothetical protein [Amycolatopsis cihanbeyliensis]|uniref:hypothetical protein n=1 Tax=Amycolatopsis cihanbeyliensis TaxID=1128664 RepID=UPI00114FF2A8|nr:hypothetical protein [Amycolatopsis cihanbeyliensis]
MRTTTSEHRRSGPRAEERGEEEPSVVALRTTTSEHRRSGPRAEERGEEEPSVAAPTTGEP